ncbi:MAG: glycosyltransferase family 39 protein [Bacteroidetes bacterium]|nr:glycosyltransferase family 39 protein [Bacteroidota bacterium]
MNSKDKIKITTVSLLQLLLLLVLPLAPCFNDLGKLPIRIWDEARQAHNAFEMYSSQNYWVPTFDGLPDTFGTKPTVLIWFQVWSMKLFGINEFAVRFPSAVSTWLLSTVLMFFVWKYFKSYSIALITGILLLTSQALIRTHVSRTGDFDAPLAFFSGVACFSFFIFLDTQKRMYWYFTCIGIAFAVLMKGTAGILFIPSLIIFSLFQKKFFLLLKSGHTCLGILLFLGLVLGYYFMRNYYQPGYIQLVVQSEWQSMYLKPAQGHKEGFWFYGINFYTLWFKSYWYLLPLGILSSLFIQDALIKKIAIFGCCCIGGFYLIISMSATKLFWYDAPIYVFVVLLCAVFFYLIEEQLIKKHLLTFQRNTIRIILVIGFATFGFTIIKPEIIDTKEDVKEKYFYTMATYLQQANQSKVDLNGYKFLSGQSYAPHHTFYLKQMKNRGERVSAVEFKDLLINDSIMVFETNIHEMVLQKFYITPLRHENDIFAYRLDSLKFYDSEK